MNGLSPTLEGFRAATRRPSLSFAEIVWRWCVGATAWGVLLFTIAEFLNTIPVTEIDLLLLRTKNPFLVGQVLRHLFHGSLARLELAVALGFLLVLILWIFVASAGRYVTARALLSYFDPSFFTTNQAQASSEQAAIERPESSGRRSAFGAVFGLTFLRASAFIGGLFGVAAAALLAGFAAGDGPNPGLAFVVFIPIAAFVFCAWGVLNWFLSLATVFAVRDAASTLDSLSDAVGLCRDRLGSVFAVSAWSGTAHAALFMSATAAVFFPISLASVVNARLVLAGIILITLAYFAVVDYLYMARMAGYVCIAQGPDLGRQASDLGPPTKALNTEDTRGPQSDPASGSACRLPETPSSDVGPEKR